MAQDLNAVFKRFLFPVAVAWGVLNLVGAGFALRYGETGHAAIHAVLALAFGVWAQRLQRRTDTTVFDERIATLQEENAELRRKLSETQDGLTFAEQLLGERHEPAILQRQGENSRRLRLPPGSQVAHCARDSMADRLRREDDHRSTRDG